MGTSGGAGRSQPRSRPPTYLASYCLQMASRRRASVTMCVSPVRAYPALGFPPSRLAALTCPL